MAIGYTRVHAADIVSGAIIEADHFNGEYDLIQSAMNASTGHNHDGTTGGGAKIDLTTASTGILPISRGGTNASTALNARNSLGLAIGTNVQAFDSDLAIIAGFTPAANSFLVGTGSTWANKTLTETRAIIGVDPAAIGLLAANNLSDLTNVPTARSNLGLGTAAVHAAEDFLVAAGTGIAVVTIGVSQTIYTDRQGASEWGGTSTGSANAQAITLSPIPNTYITGMKIVWKAGAGLTNTGVCTIDVNTLGVRTIFKNNATLTGGEIVAGSIYEAVYDGTRFQLLTPTSTQHGGLINVQYFTTTGTSTYTATAGTNFIIAEVQAGGASGGGAQANDATHDSLGGGGGSGGYGRKKITSGFNGVTVTVGAGGAVTAPGAVTGNSGGISSFGAAISATGGGGGGAGVSLDTPDIGGDGGSHGTCSDGDLNVNGAEGLRGYTYDENVVFSGAGAGSYFGGGAQMAAFDNDGRAAFAYGAGGSGGCTRPNGTAKRGGAGKQGIVIVWEYN